MTAEAQSTSQQATRNDAAKSAARFGVVVIGRNEGERLRRCLQSVVAQPVPNDQRNRPTIVYVDSGSTDDSIAIASELGADVVELDLSQPFTAARARNAGFLRLLELDETIDLVQFVDGDCEVVEDWFDHAVARFAENDRVGIVVGRLREINREATVYNRLCDLEWDVPVGEVDGCGGIAMMRTDAVQQVGGFNADLIAGEEPEMCLRLRRHGWTIHRIDTDMARHDAAMIRFGQWFRRAMRNGYAVAEGAVMHGGGPERYRRKELRSILLWGLLFPISALALAWWTFGLSIALAITAYLFLWYRVRQYRRQGSEHAADASLYARFVVIGKFAEVLGAMKYGVNRLLGRRGRIIEYKQAEAEQ